MEFSCINCALIIKETLEYLAQIVVFVKCTIRNFFKTPKRTVKELDSSSGIRTRNIKFLLIPIPNSFSYSSKAGFCWSIFLSSSSAHWTTTKPPGFQRHHYNSNREMGPCARPRPELQNHLPTPCGWKTAVCKFSCLHSPSTEMFWSRTWVIFQLWWWVAEYVLRKFKARVLIITACKWERCDRKPLPTDSSDANHRNMSVM